MNRGEKHKLHTGHTHTQISNRVTMTHPPMDWCSQFNDTGGGDRGAIIIGSINI